MNASLPLYRKLLPLAFLASAVLAVEVAPLAAQQKRVSPHETISQVVGGGRVTLVYGRPYSKNPKTGELRTIWGSLVPYGRPWRTGADEATLLITQKPIVLGGTALPAGAYTLFTQPEADGSAQLIISKQIGQWGLQYNPNEDFARVPLERYTLSDRVDQFTMGLVKNSDGSGTLKMEWELTGYSVRFTVPK